MYDDFFDPTPIDSVVDAIGRDKYTVEISDSIVLGSHVVTNDETGVRARIQPTEGEPDQLNICTADNDLDDWEELSSDPAEAVGEIERWTEN